MTKDEEIAYLKNKLKEMEDQLMKLKLEVLADKMPSFKKALKTFRENEAIKEA